MKAWEAYKASEDYENTRKWALYEEHVDGSLWAAFVVGYRVRESQIRPKPQLGIDHCLVHGAYVTATPASCPFCEALSEG